MEKGLSYGALGVAVIMLLVFLLDLFTGSLFGAPSGNPFVTADVIGVIASLIVAYLGFSAARDLK